MQFILVLVGIIGLAINALPTHQHLEPGALDWENELTSPESAWSTGSAPIGIPASSRIGANMLDLMRARYLTQIEEYLARQKHELFATSQKNEPFADLNNDEGDFEGIFSIDDLE